MDAELNLKIGDKVTTNTYYNDILQEKYRGNIMTIKNIKSNYILVEENYCCWMYKWIIKIPNNDFFNEEEFMI